MRSLRLELARSCQPYTYWGKQEAFLCISLKRIFRVTIRADNFFRAGCFSFIFSLWINNRLFWLKFLLFVKLVHKLLPLLNAYLVILGYLKFSKSAKLVVLQTRFQFIFLVDFGNILSIFQFHPRYMVST